MRERYGKPKRFSDPHHDWYDCPERLQEILDKDDKDLTLNDFGAVFSKHLPAADYQEGLYYIPLCFDHMLKKEDLVASNICRSVFWYIAHFRESLESDGFFDNCFQMIKQLIRRYTQDFGLIRLNDDELDKYGIDPAYREMAKYCSSVHDIVDCLIEHSDYWDILCDWVEILNKTSLVGSCWWVEISHHSRIWHVIYRENDQANDRKEKLICRLHKFGEYSHHWRSASQWAASKRFFEYNRKRSLM